MRDTWTLKFLPKIAFNTLFRMLETFYTQIYSPRRPTFHVCPLTQQFSLDGRKERVQFDKITARVSRLCYGLDPTHVDAAAITQKVISGVYQGVTTVELDNLVSISLSNLRRPGAVINHSNAFYARPRRQQRT